MSSVNKQNVDSYYLSEEFRPIGSNLSTNTTPYCIPSETQIKIQTFPKHNTSVPKVDFKQMDETLIASNKTFSPFGTHSSTSENSLREMTPLEVMTQLGTNTFPKLILPKKSVFSCDSRDDKIEFKILVEYLENMRKNNQIFQTNIREEIKQMKEVMAELKKSIQEMPIKFADALTHCLDSVNGQSDSVSVDSEPEIVDYFDKIDVTEDQKGSENNFVDFADTSFKEMKSDSKFVFEYNPYLDLDKWLKKD